MTNKPPIISPDRINDTSEELRFVARAIELGANHGMGMGRAAMVRRHLGSDGSDEQYMMEFGIRNDEERAMQVMLLYLAAEVWDDQCPTCGRDW